RSPDLEKGVDERSTAHSAVNHESHGLGVSHLPLLQNPQPPPLLPHTHTHSHTHTNTSACTYTNTEKYCNHCYYTHTHETHLITQNMLFCLHTHTQKSCQAQQ